MKKNIFFVVYKTLFVRFLFRYFNLFCDKMNVDVSKS